MKFIFTFIFTILLVIDISKAKTPLIAARLKDMLVNSYTQWIVPEKLANILDKSYQTDRGIWNAKKDPHPFLRERKQEIRLEQDARRDRPHSAHPIMYH